MGRVIQIRALQAVAFQAQGTGLVGHLVAVVALVIAATRGRLSYEGYQRETALPALGNASDKRKRED